MKMRFAGLVVAAGLVFLLAVGAGACTDGGGGALTLEEFFQRVEELDADFEAGNAEIEAELGELSDEEALDQGPDLLGRLAELVGEFVDELAALDPPEEATDLLEEAVSAGRNVADTFDGLVAELEGAQSLDDLFSFFEDPDFMAARGRFSQVCSDLEQLAADNGITIELNCEDEEGGDGTGGGALEAYFGELDTLENAFRVASDQADADLAALDATATPGDVAAIFEDVVAAIDTLVAGLEGLDPPEEVAEAHAESVAGFQFVSTALSDAIANVGDYATVEEFFAIFDDPEFVSADQSLDGVCRALQSIADGNGIVVDLGCPE